jgi:hypothetical protein
MAYAAYYRETNGQTIEVWALVVQMVEQFMDSDRGFPRGAVESVVASEIRGLGREREAGSDCYRPRPVTLPSTLS